jgi:anti-anti-sigma factor
MVTARTTSNGTVFRHTRCSTAWSAGHSICVAGRALQLAIVTSGNGVLRPLEVTGFMRQAHSHPAQRSAPPSDFDMAGLAASRSVRLARRSPRASPSHLGEGAKMHQQSADGPPVVVSLPVEIDVTNAGQVYDVLIAAAAAGAPVVIVDCTATVFCDAAGVRCLITGHTRAAARGVQLRLVTAPGGLLRRLLELLGADSVLPVYPSVEEARVPVIHPARDPLSLPLMTAVFGPLHAHPVTRVRLSVLVWDSLG